MRYEKYKQTGIAWLPEIPEEWECVTLGRLLAEPLSYGASESGEVQETSDSVRYIRITDITTDGKLKCDGCKFLERTKAEGFILSKGDVLFARSGATVGKSYIFNENMEACYAGYLIRASVKRDKLMPEFLAYFSQTKNYEEWKSRIFIQATIQNISAAKYSRLAIMFPLLPEQRAIVAYLDDKCGKIDELVAAKEKEVELLKELKQTVIADAVTRGISHAESAELAEGVSSPRSLRSLRENNRRLVPSGIPWLPQIPEGWEVKQLRSLLKMVSVKGCPDKQLLSVTREQGVIVRNIESKEENHNYIPEDLSNYKLVEQGDFAINKMKSWQGSYGVSDYEGIVSPAYYVCKLSGVDRKFFSTAIRSRVYVSFFARFSKGIRVDQWDLSPIGLKTIPFFLPPLDEQRAIVAYIEEKTAKIDQAVAGLAQQVAALKEYKQRLIADVVTGQMRVA